MDFIKNNLKKIIHKNYKYIEIIIGQSLSENIFNSQITESQFEKVFSYFKTKLKQYGCKTIISKNYEILNKRLTINEQFQQRCFEQTLLDKQLYTYKNLDCMITFGEKKMISIENFDISQQYDNQLLKKITSFNIKNQFYLNFITNENQITKQIYYSIQLYITKKNGKYNEIIDLLQLYISTIQQLLHETNITESKNTTEITQTKDTITKYQYYLKNFSNYNNEQHKQFSIDV
tara:strand:- start:330 stop:1028 length:699 start_codon:yes stop_codon:yes gene_type:complete